MSSDTFSLVRLSTISLTVSNSRCFPHIVNLAVKAGLERLTVLPTDFVAQADPEDDLYDSEDEADTMSLEQYRSILEKDLIVASRKLVNGCRASDRRRSDFADTIRDGNTRTEQFDGHEIPESTLLRDMEVRWSSTFLMVDRTLELYPVRPRLCCYFQI